MANQRIRSIPIRHRTQNSLHPRLSAIQGLICLGCALTLYPGSSLAQSSNFSSHPAPAMGQPPAANNPASQAEANRNLTSHAISAEADSAAPTPTPTKPFAENSIPATVTLTGGLLTVRANNSDLTQILDDIARIGHMKINGYVANSRVFGMYGPRTTREVLTDLLAGSGSNFLMAGITREGAPRELTLTQQTGSATPAAAPAPPPDPNAAAVVAPVLNSDGSQRDEQNLGPGAIADVPPGPPEDLEERVRQHMNRMEQIRKAQDNPTPQ